MRIVYFQNNSTTRKEAVPRNKIIYRHFTCIIYETEIRELNRTDVKRRIILVSLIMDCFHYSMIYK